MAEEHDPIAFLNSISLDEGQHSRFAEYMMVNDEALNNHKMLTDKYEDEVEAIRNLDYLKFFGTKLYEALYFLLTGTLWDGCPIKNNKLSDAVMGAENFVWPDDPADLGVYELNKNTTLPEIVEALESVNLNELKKDFDPKEYQKKHIPYFGLGFTRDEWFNALTKEYIGLLNFYREAKDKNAHVIIWLFGVPIDPEVEDYLFGVDDEGEKT
jgi:hypothetical protein